MGKQYTFRLTRDTKWVENTLDKMESQHRSNFIREAIIQKIKQKDVTHVTQEVTQKVTHVTQEVTQTTPPPLIEDKEKITENIDFLNKKLDSLF